MHAFANAGYRIVSIDTARLDNRPEYGMLIHMEFVPAPFNIGRTLVAVRCKLGGRPVLSADWNVETAGSERKRPEI